MKKLISIMDGQLNEYRALLELSQEKKKVIIAGDIHRLNEIVSLEKEHVASATKFEQEREKRAEEIGKIIGVGAPRLDDIIKHAKSPAKEELSELKKNFDEVLGELKALNEENAGLIHMHLEYLDFMLNLASDSGEVSNLYENDGSSEKSRATSLGLLDASV